MAKPRDRWVAPDEVADYLGIPRRNRPRAQAAKYPTSETVRKKKAVVALVKTGELEAMKVSGEWRVRWASVIAYERRQTRAVSGAIASRDRFMATSPDNENCDVAPEVRSDAI